MQMFTHRGKFLGDVRKIENLEESYRKKHVKLHTENNPS